VIPVPEEEFELDDLSHPCFIWPPELVAGGLP